MDAGGGCPIRSELSLRFPLLLERSLLFIEYYSDSCEMTYSRKVGGLVSI